MAEGHRWRVADRRVFSCRDAPGVSSLLWTQLVELIGKHDSLRLEEEILESADREASAKGLFSAARMRPS